MSDRLKRRENAPDLVVEGESAPYFDEEFPLGLADAGRLSESDLSDKQRKFFDDNQDFSDESWDFPEESAAS